MTKLDLFLCFIGFHLWRTIRSVIEKTENGFVDLSLIRESAPVKEEGVMTKTELGNTIVNLTPLAKYEVTKKYYKCKFCDKTKTVILKESIFP